MAWILAHPRDFAVAVLLILIGLFLLGALVGALLDDGDDNEIVCDLTNYEKARDRVKGPGQEKRAS